jgi:UDP-N-acetylmuramoyl-tripeptide--D-alanyl-D-alanine ligase
MPVATKFEITTADEAGELEILGTVGTQLVYSYTAAVAVARELGVSLAIAATGLSEATPPPGRMKLIPGLKGTMLIDDTYNSSPIAAEQALVALGELRAPGRKIAVLGDMLELGKFSNDEHVRIGQLAGKVVQVVFTVGIRAQKIAHGALLAGLAESVIFQFEDAESAGKALQSYLQSGDIVLVKGSQGMRMERVVEEVMAEPELAETLLVRQDQEWKQRN